MGKKKTKRKKVKINNNYYIISRKRNLRIKIRR